MRFLLHGFAGWVQPTVSLVADRSCHRQVEVVAVEIEDYVLVLILQMWIWTDASDLISALAFAVRPALFVSFEDVDWNATTSRLLLTWQDRILWWNTKIRAIGIMDFIVFYPLHYLLLSRCQPVRSICPQRPHSRLLNDHLRIISNTYRNTLHLSIHPRHELFKVRARTAFLIHLKALLDIPLHVLIILEHLHLVILAKLVERYRPFRGAFPPNVVTANILGDVASTPAVFSLK